jgi:hypothetical protein
LAGSHGIFDEGPFQSVELVGGEACHTSHSIRESGMRVGLQISWMKAGSILAVCSPSSDNVGL